MPELARHYDNNAHIRSAALISERHMRTQSLVWAGPVMSLFQGVRRVIHLPFAAHFVFRLEHLVTLLQCLQWKDLNTTSHKRLLKECCFLPHSHLLFAWFFGNFHVDAFLACFFACLHVWETLLVEKNWVNRPKLRKKEKNSSGYAGLGWFLLVSLPGLVGVQLV